MALGINPNNDRYPIENISENGEEFFALLTYIPRQDLEEIEDAFQLAKEEHAGLKRKSGEPFICHPLTVASYLAEYFADTPTLIAALLHDVAEDAEVTVQDIEHRYGSEVRRIVDGVTKFDKVTGEARLGRKLTKQELTTATHYKLFETMTADVRVGVVKIFDRLHNMRTICHMPFHKQEEKSRETLAVYAPLADRLGMWKIKNELESLALNVLHPARFRQFKQAIENRSKRNNNDFPNLETDLKKLIDDAGLELVSIVQASEDISGAFRVWQEEQEGRVLFGPPQPVILLKNEIDCYTALGHLHAMWRPVAGKFDDYISATRHNLYRSLHTTIIYEGRRVKVRIRTLEMQLESQNGVLSRWTDTRNIPIWTRQTEEKVDKLFNQFQKAYADDEDDEFDEKVRHILDDVFHNQITVFTPNGDEIELPRGATPVDFAYRIHTEVGHGCRGVLVNSERQPLTYELQDGDSILIEKEINSAKPHPQLAWLDEDLGYIRTRTGRQGVRKWFKKLSPNMAKQIGRTMIKNELATMGKSEFPLEEVRKILRYSSVDELCISMGRAELLIAEFSNTLLEGLWEKEDLDSRSNSDYRNKFTTSQAVFSPEEDMFIIEHSGDRELLLCDVCRPRPGDPITGSILPNNQVNIHVNGCRLLTPDSMRGGHAIKLRWGSETDKDNRAVTLQVYAHDREGLLNDITTIFREDEININFLWSKTEHYKALIIFSADVSRTNAVIRFLHRAQDLRNVIHAGYLGQTKSEHIIPENFFAGNPECNLKELDKKYASDIGK